MLAGPFLYWKPFLKKPFSDFAQGSGGSYLVDHVLPLDVLFVTMYDCFYNSSTINEFMNSNADHFSSRFRSERARLGVSQTEFCAAGGVSKSTQVAYENGQRVPDLEYLDGVTTLGVDPVFIVTGLPSKVFAAKHFDWDLHNEIISTISEFQAEQGISIPPAKLGDLIHHLCEEFTAAGSIEPATLARALRLVA